MPFSVTSRTIGFAVYRSLTFQLDYFSKIDPYVPSNGRKIVPQYPRLSYKDAVEFCAPFGICESKIFKAEVK